MKGFNVFLAIVIFLLAATSAVFSYFLYEKRANLVTGHSYFAKQLTEATQKLERNSGTQLSKAVTTETLKHDKSPKQVNDQLTEFNKLVSAVVDERDVLAATLSQVSSSLELRTDKSRFTNLGSYKNATNKLSSHAQEYRERNDAILNRLVSSGENLGTRKLSVSALKSSNYSNAYKELEDRVSFWINRHKSYNSSISQIASALKANRPNINESNYNTVLRQLVSHAQTVERQRMDYLAKWRNEERKVRDRDTTIRSLQGTIADKDGVIKNKNLEIKRLETMLGIKPGRRAIKEGGIEALQLVRKQQKGKIMEVNGKFGFVVVSLGKKTLVQDYYEYKPTNESKLEIRQWDVNPVIEAGMVLTVARNMASGEAKYINKVKIVKVDDYCAIAESVDRKTGKTMNEGDMVYLADDEIAKYAKMRK